MRIYPWTIQIRSVPWFINFLTEKKVLVWRIEKQCISVLDVGKMFTVCFWQLDVPRKGDKNIGDIKILRDLPGQVRSR